MRMAQYIGLTNKAQTYADKKLIRIEDKDLITLPEGAIIYRDSWTDLAGDNHPMAMYRDPIDEIYYVETIQCIAHSGGPMYFTMLMEYKSGVEPRVCDIWTSGEWSAGLDEYDSAKGVIYIITPNTWERQQMTIFPPIEEVMVYDHDLKHFIWPVSRKAVMFYGLPVGCESLTKVSVYLHKMDDHYYIVKVNKDKHVISIQKVLEKIESGTDMVNLKRRKVDNLKIDMHDPLSKIYR